MSHIGHSYSGGEQQSALDRFEDIGGNAIVYSYPNGDFDVICAAEKSFHGKGWEAAEDMSREGKAKPAARAAGRKSQGDDMLRSMRRARAKLRRLALSNGFTHFVTLTLDREKVDRYEPQLIMKQVNRILDNLVRRHGLRYILVPEQHKDGAYHFHGFIAGESLDLRDSGVQRDGRPVFNWAQWPLGFSTAQTLYGEYSAAVAYVCKYIGKQQGQRPMGRWYYSGGRLAEPPKEYATLDYRELARDFEGEAVEIAIPGTQMLVIHHKSRRSTS